ncbi:MAG: hypothetical protein ACREUU_08375 [Gammaproteobacteria bacterium]
MFTKSHILAETRRTALKNGGKPLGIARFHAETGIKSSDWRGKLWARWSDALVEAGFQPNLLQGPRDGEELLEKLAASGQLAADFFWVQDANIGVTPKILHVKRQNGFHAVHIHCRNQSGIMDFEAGNTMGSHLVASTPQR